MPDPHVISALADKAHALRSAIVSYEEHLDRTRHELAVVTATLTIMARDGHLLTDNRRRTSATCSGAESRWRFARRLWQRSRSA